MRKGTAAGMLSVSGILLMAVALTPAGQAAGTGRLANAAGQYGKLPLTFEENRGQTDARVRYISRGAGYTLFLTPEEALLSLSASQAGKGSQSTAVRMVFAGAEKAEVTASETLASRSSYFNGQDSANWITGVRHFSRVNYKGLYKGIDAVFYGNQRQLEYDFLVAPGADPNQIRLRFEGVSSLGVAPDGDLILQSALGEFRQMRPVIYQVENGRRKTIEGRYKVTGSEATFEIARYNRRLPLVIDPVLAWSTFIGGNSTETVTGVAVNAARETIITGYTASSDFPAALRFIGTIRGGASDIFITKFSQAGNAVVWSAFAGGQGADQATSIAVDDEGSIYVCGMTDSANFPVAPNTTSERPIQDVIGGAQDAFIMKISASGNALPFSTFYGGFGNDIANEIRVTADRQPVVVGTTASTNFNAVRGAYAAYSGGIADAWVAKLNADGRGTTWSTYLGGGSADFGNSVAVDSTGAVYATGSTTSVGFPRTGGVVQPTLRSVSFSDAFVTKFSPTGALVYSTYLGGTANDEGLGIAVDVAGNPFILGNTESTNFPMASAVQAANAGNRDVFITKLNSTASALGFSTYLGGTGIEAASELTLYNGMPHVIGTTNSTNFPVGNAIQPTIAGASDTFIVEMNEHGAIRSSTYFGGSGDDFGFGIATDNAGNIYFGGRTSSFNLPVLNQTQTVLNNIEDGYVARISNCVLTLTPVHNGAPGVVVPNTATTATITIAGSTDCAWVAQSSSDWIALTGSTTGAGPGTVSYTVAGNIGAPRTGYITVGGVRFDIAQEGGTITDGGCVYPLTTAAYIAPAQGALSTFQIGTNGTCNWTATSSATWLQVFPPNGNNTTTANFTVYPNFGTQPRVAFITVANGAFTRTFTVTQAASLLNEQQRFVTLLYSNFLGRYPQQGETDAWVASGTARPEMATSFFNAAEFNLGGRLVAAAYVVLLGRLPEFAGWQFNRNAVATGVVTQNQLVANFVNSQEFQLRWGTLSNEAFVILLYQQALGRTPSQTEINFHASGLNNGTNTRANVATVFLSVPEFVLRSNSVLNAYLLHSALLQRDPSTSEMLNRRSQIETNVPLRDIIAEFVTSPEFTSRLQ